MNENIDLTKILKDCPEGTKLWSIIYGEVTFCNINTEEYGVYCPIETKDCSLWLRRFTKGGKLSEDHRGECLLVPSKEQRDWSKFSAPWYKKDKFDPKTLQPFDKVLARGHDSHRWTCDLFSDIIDGDECIMYHCIISYYKYCIPYNDETKHLIGTRDEAPEFYRYWED